jgi:glycosyltransferase involved in cell wall biosynthesis
VSATYPPYYAGTGTVVEQNAEALAARGHTVTVVTARRGGRRVREGSGVTVRRLRALIRLGNAPLLPGLFLLPRHNLVHLHYPFIFGAETVLLLARLRNQPYVLTYHNDLIASGLKGLLFDVYERMWSRALVTRARVVIVPSWDGAISSPVVGPLMRLRPDRFVEIPNAIDMDSFRDLPATSTRAMFGIPDDGPVILFVGSMDSAHHPKGGVSVLLDALARARTVGVRAVLAGDGDRIPEYRTQAASLGLAGRVHFLGPIPHQAMPRVYAAADVVVQPSQLFEPFGLVAVEAMACGRPVIASDLPGVRRVVADAGGGVLTPPGDPEALAGAIDRLLADEALRRRLAGAGRAGVEQRYDAARTGSLLEATYARALSSR